MNIRPMPVFIGFLILLGCSTAAKERITRTGFPDEKPLEYPELRLSFVIDRQYDEGGIIAMLRSNGPAGYEYRAKDMGIDLETARKIHEYKNPAEVNGLVRKMVDDRFLTEAKAIQAGKGEFEALWKDLLPIFSNVVTETTQSPWVHPEYICVVSSFHPGLSDWVGNIVAIKYNEMPTFKRRILAHEILLSDTFQLLRKRYSKPEITDWQVWAFSEITAVLILDDPRLQVFWPDFPHAGSYFGPSNYPQIAGLEKQLKDLFDKRKSYQDYEEKAAVILKNLSQTIPRVDRP